LIIKKTHNILHLKPGLSVIILSGLVGCCLGLSNASWQVAVETGQVLAGIVKYPVENPFYMYHIKAFTIINHISALLLLLIKSEKVVSIIISGLLGMISFQALGMLIFAINRNIYISVLGVLFIYFTNYVGEGVIYPIWLLGQPHTFGILGLSFTVLVIALIASECYRAGLFCLGLIPCIHAPMAIWLFLIIFAAGIFHRDFVKKIIRTYYWYFLAGLAISILLLLYQLHLMQILPTIEPETKKQYLDSFTKYWDSHRRQFYWDSAVPMKEHFARWGIFFCIYSVVVGFLGLKYFKGKSPLAFAFRVIIASGILSLFLGIMTHLPSEDIPSFMLILMPGRFINLNNVVFAASLLGILTYGGNKDYKANYNIFVFLLVCSFFSRTYQVQFYSSAAVLIWLAYVTFYKCYNNKTSFRNTVPVKFLYKLIKKRVFLFTEKHKVGYESLLLFFIVIFLAINLPREAFIRHYLVYPGDFKNLNNSEFYLKASQGSGIMLTTHHAFTTPLKTRRPILVDMASPNFFLYALESSEIYNNILKKAYGIDLLIPPPREYRHRGILPDLYKELWEKRSVEEWQAIKNEFNVVDILTRIDWELSLPVITKNESMILYEIP